MSFKDHFSGHAAEYAQFRPRYPEQLFRYLASVVPTQHCAWDCATGNGQAALALAGYFERVIATDAGAEQIRSAEASPRVEFHVARAEESGIDSKSVDLVTVAQALHWFDIPGFFTEARRVLLPNGILAVWAYNLFQIEPVIDALIEHFYRHVTGPFWPPERDIVESGYANIAFPFRELAAPAFEMRTEWNLDRVLGYLRTWSATRRFIAAHGLDPVDELADRLRRAWDDRDEARQVRWPLSFRVAVNDEQNSLALARILTQKEKRRVALRPAPPLS